MYDLSITWEGGNRNHHARSKRYLKQSAKLGYSQAQYALGYFCYYRNKKSENIKWLELAAAQDNIDALHILGKVCLSGFPHATYYNKVPKMVIKPDIKRGIDLLHRCLQFSPNYKLVHTSLSELHRKGIGVTKDLFKACYHAILSENPYKMHQDEKPYIMKLYKEVYNAKLLSFKKTRTGYLHRIKSVVESDKVDNICWSDQHYIKYAFNDYVAINKERVCRVKQMRDALGKTNLYVTVLHDIIKDFIYHEETLSIENSDLNT